MIGLLVACTAGIGFAQKMNAEQRAAKAVSALNEVIPDLSETQKEQLKAANLKQAKDMMAFRKETGPGDVTEEQKEAGREKTKALRMEKNEAYKKILTEEQLAKLKAHAENQKKAPKGKKGNAKKPAESSL